MVGPDTDVIGLPWRIDAGAVGDIYAPPSSGRYADLSNEANADDMAWGDYQGSRDKATQVAGLSGDAGRVCDPLRALDEVQKRDAG